MENFNIGYAVGAFVGLFLVYCLFLFVRGLFKSNPLDYVKILDLESKFKEKKYDDLDEKGESILLQAINLGAEGLALDMIKSGKIDVLKPSRDGATAFFYAVICDNSKLIKALLKKGEQVEPKKCGKFGSPLLWASRAGSDYLIDFFLERGADINRQTMKIKYTPLMGACFTLKEASVVHLIEKGADKTLKNREKNTALDVYKKSGGKSKKILKMLEV
jgi:ankyrin repeat protein